MYDTEEDSYCYPGTTVLINKLDLRNQDELSAFELEISNQRANEPIPLGLYSRKHYLAIHKHLFQDVYDWAGKIRTVRIFKEGAPFCFLENINKHMRLLFGDLAEQQYFCGLGSEDFAKKAAHFLAELNAIHPFREGNGRTQLTFLTMLADQAAHPFDMKSFDEKAIFDATVESFGGNETDLQGAIGRLIGKANAARME
jgi:cell filamentation protein